MIDVKNISKKFKVYHNRKDRLKEWLTLGRKVCHQDVWALQEISLKIPKGEIFGLVGLNGAGKSTLLKIITGTLSPTSGTVAIDGKVAALLELGTGFHEELTGRDNVIINGKLLGLSEQEILERLGAIEEFSELGDYFYKPVRTYSTGMYVRLAFSLATSVDPDVLIIDEALSVGDAYFQQKCARRMESFKQKGTTILFVSHDLGMVKLFCDRVALMQNGRVETVGEARDVLELYNARLAEHCEGFSLSEYNKTRGEGFGLSSGNGKAKIESVQICTQHSENVFAIEAGEECQVLLDVNFRESITNPTIGILIRDRLGYDIFGTNTKRLYKRTGSYLKDEKARFRFFFPMNLGPGDYTVSVAIHQDDAHTGECYQWVDRILSFKVLPRADFQFLGVSLLRTRFSVEKRPESVQ